MLTHPGRTKPTGVFFIKKTNFFSKKILSLSKIFCIIADCNFWNDIFDENLEIYHKSFILNVFAFRNAGYCIC